jgi:hypothetical protein
MNDAASNSIRWLSPWEAVDNGAVFEAELRREVVSGHPLYGLSAVAVGRRLDCDDVLFRIDHPSCALAVVHLTWRMQPEHDQTWPQTRLFHHCEEWIQNCLKPDHAQYEGQNK